MHNPSDNWCPFTYGAGPGKNLDYYLRKPSNCALFDTEHKQCAIQTIAQNMEHYYHDNGWENK